MPVSATPRPTSRTERRKARTAGAILEAAERLFLGRGYNATTMEDLSEAADVAVGSIYATSAARRASTGPRRSNPGAGPAL